MTPARWEQALRQRTRGWDEPAVDHRRLLRQAHRAIRWRLARAWAISMLAGVALFTAGAALPDPGPPIPDDEPAGTDDGSTNDGETPTEVGDVPPEPSEVTLTIVPAGDGDGRITDDDEVLECPEACERRVERGSTVTLTATPQPSSDLIEWGYDDCRAPDSCDVTVDEDVELQPRFEPERWLTVTTGPDAGLVRVQEEEPPCRGTCRYRLTHSSSVRLEAIEVGDAAFHGWNLEDCAGETTCVITITRDTTATARFHQPVELEVIIECSGFRPEEGCGTVRIEPGSLTCETGTCPHRVPWGSDLTLTAEPADGFLLLEWSDDCETSTVDDGGAAGTCTLTANAHHSVTATFQVQLF